MTAPKTAKPWPVGRPFTPDSASPPGATITDRLEELGKDIGWLWACSGVDEGDLHMLISGQCAVTVEVAQAIAPILGGSVAFWLNREAHYRAHIARIHGGEL